LWQGELGIAVRTLEQHQLNLVRGPGNYPRAPVAWVDLYWIPLGAGDRTGLVAPSGRFYERVAARRAHRHPQPLFHSALLVRLDGVTWAVEVAPAWGASAAGRGVVAQGAVGHRRLGWSRWFRYEVRCRDDGYIPDLSFAVDGPRRLSADRSQAASVLALTREVPRLTWGRDDLGAGDMWNSNSVVSWLLARSGHFASDVGPPSNGRAPGWRAGLIAAIREAETTHEPA
jgi:hypothetical protein